MEGFRLAHPGAEMFHRRWMGSNEAKKRLVRPGCRDGDRLCPQHEAIHRGRTSGASSRWFRDLQMRRPCLHCGAPRDPVAGTSDGGPPRPGSLSGRPGGRDGLSHAPGRCPSGPAARTPPGAIGMTIPHALRVAAPRGSVASGTAGRDQVVSHAPSVAAPRGQWLLDGGHRR